jgi:hypothetical protein
VSSVRQKPGRHPRRRRAEPGVSRHRLRLAMTASLGVRKGIPLRTAGQRRRSWHWCRDGRLAKGAVAGGVRRAGSSDGGRCAGRLRWSAFRFAGGAARRCDRGSAATRAGQPRRPRRRIPSVARPGRRCPSRLPGRPRRGRPGHGCPAAGRTIPAPQLKDGPAGSRLARPAGPTVNARRRSARRVTARASMARTGARAAAGSAM